MYVTESYNEMLKLSITFYMYFIQKTFMIEKKNLLWFFVQVPAKPNYSLVLYYAADRPVNNNSLLGKFANGTDLFRDSRFKLIPSIAEVSLFAGIKTGCLSMSFI